jgi:hypothetical protein
VYFKNQAKDDEYMTPKSAWEQIAPFIPKEKVIYEPIDFFLNTHRWVLGQVEPPPTRVVASSRVPLLWPRDIYNSRPKQNAIRKRHE